ncbi:Flp family type IVb pilin [Desulfosporosinus lacus]|uniref:Pilus assembly protein Flp/PilA n=1 Tax=Desulfosporosinus lacus DSM 15449 TaxID=1121420 RepID=A0A1M5WBV6_9FIRM|nr:Flp family type IVb pilin [Desulfosporosinus lacus]SHH84976.1 pilus assembly protein Flp/PilA [Desulfosporosinus lacus DSM 15449]
MKTRLIGFLKDETGQAMTEYGLIIALVAVGVIIALTAMGGQLSTLFNSLVAKLTPAT